VRADRSFITSDTPRSEDPAAIANDVLAGVPAAIVGSALFVVSDSILGWRQFVAEHRWMPVAIMVTYHGALLGLALTLAG